MAGEERNQAAFRQCKKQDLTRGAGALALWCLPVAALIAGLNWPEARPWLWIPALLIMGVGCWVNAARCGRLHCYLSTPIFLIGAAYVVLAQFGLVPLPPGMFLDALLVATVLACMAELPLGKYRIDSNHSGTATSDSSPSKRLPPLGL